MSILKGISLTIAVIAVFTLIIALGPAAIAGTILFLLVLGIILGISS